MERESEACGMIALERGGVAERRAPQIKYHHHHYPPEIRIKRQALKEGGGSTWSDSKGPIILTKKMAIFRADILKNRVQSIKMNVQRR